MVNWAYTQADFDHVARLKGYTNLITSSLIHTVCRGDDLEDLSTLSKVLCKVSIMWQWLEDLLPPASGSSVSCA